MESKLLKMSILESICREIDLTDTQRQVAEEHYNAVGRYLADFVHPWLSNANIYPQGSMALGTTVKPLGQDEYDVDLVGNLPLAIEANPTELKKVIGDCLRQNGTYRNILEEKTRCWRLNYKGEFHMDITPSILNPKCENGGELVPDKKLEKFSPSNPKGYIKLFCDRALLRPSRLRAEIAPLPEDEMAKGILRRTVQLCKRNRDVFFQNKVEGEFAPISIIITTLASQSYESCVKNGTYETELDVLFDTVCRMSDFIKKEKDNFYVMNETTEGENFAEKWNTDKRYCQAFHSWHQNMISTLTLLRDEWEGLDIIGKNLFRSFGESATRASIRVITENVDQARKKGVLPFSLVASTASSPVISKPIRPNTFYGK